MCKCPGAPSSWPVFKKLKEDGWDWSEVYMWEHGAEGLEGGRGPGNAGLCSILIQWEAIEGFS